jgi:hypothetical protein
MNAGRLLSQFRISAAMRSYVLRVRLRGTDFEFGSEPEQAVAYTKCIREMRRILVEKRRISAIAADRAILKSLEAAFDFQSADLRYRFLKTMEAQSHTTLDYLIRGLRQLSNAIAQLPPNSKGELNKRVVGIIGQAQFELRNIYRDRREDQCGPAGHRTTPVGGQYPVTHSSRTGRGQAPADNRPSGKLCRPRRE